MVDWTQFIKSLSPLARAALAHASLMPMAGFADLEARTLNEIQKVCGAFTLLEIMQACDKAGVTLATAAEREPHWGKRYRFARIGSKTPPVPRGGIHVERNRYPAYPRER